MKSTHIHSCNILSFGGDDNTQLWQFHYNAGEPSLHHQTTQSNSTSISPKIAGKGWQCLWQPKLNVAWFPPDQVFLRKIQLPTSDLSEIPAMIELQLEKLSPMPVAQIVWSYEPIDRDASQHQTVIVIIVARSVVEEFLGRIEGLGFLADRLELPALHLLQATPKQGDGLWLFPMVSGNKELCLAAWWEKSELQHISLLFLPSGDDWDNQLMQQLTQIAWSGEVEGWLTPQFDCWLVTSEDLAKKWEVTIRVWAPGKVHYLAPPSSDELASYCARRVAIGGRQASLIPPENALRYRQQYTDHLWMSGVGAILLVYLAGVFIYLAALQVQIFQKRWIDSQIGKLTSKYDETMKIKARVQVLQDQMNLRYAALDCWRAAACLLPAELTLTHLSFQQGKTFVVHGVSPANKTEQIIAFNEAMGRYRVGDQPNAPLLFRRVQTYTTRNSASVGGVQTVAWDFACELARTELE